MNHNTSSVPTIFLYEDHVLYCTFLNFIFPLTILNYYCSPELFLVKMYCISRLVIVFLGLVFGSLHGD